MSIIIQNINHELRASGPHRYVLRINNKVIAYFNHSREDGLATCLRKAGAAAEDPRRQEIQDDNELLMATFAAIGEIRGVDDIE